MKDKIETAGYWYFPADIENQYAGTLVEQSGKFSLTLLGCTETPKEPFVIHGITADGKDITLYNCVFSSRTMGFPGIPQMEISALYYINGDHITTETCKFNSATLRISSLNEWVGIKRI